MTTSTFQQELPQSNKLRCTYAVVGFNISSILVSGGEAVSFAQLTPFQYTLWVHVDTSLQGVGIEILPGCLPPPVLQAMARLQLKQSRFKQHL